MQHYIEHMADPIQERVDLTESKRGYRLAQTLARWECKILHICPFLANSCKSKIGNAKAEGIGKWKIYGSSCKRLHGN